MTISLFPVRPTLRPAADESFEELNGELARWLRLRATVRSLKNREESSLDDVALALRRIRASLDILAPDTTPNTVGHELVGRTYRWAIRMAREIEAIEQLELDPIADWTRFEQFAPFALASYDSALAGLFAKMTPGRGTSAYNRLRQDVDAVLETITFAMTSSAAWAA